MRVPAKMGEARQRIPAHASDKLTRYPHRSQSSWPRDSGLWLDVVTVDQGNSPGEAASTGAPEHPDDSTLDTRTSFRLVTRGDTSFEEDATLNSSSHAWKVQSSTSSIASPLVPQWSGSRSDHVGPQSTGNDLLRWLTSPNGLRPSDQDYVTGQDTKIAERVTPPYSQERALHHSPWLTSNLNSTFTSMPEAFHSTRSRPSDFSDLPGHLEHETTFKGVPQLSELTATAVPQLSDLTTTAVPQLSNVTATVQHFINLSQPSTQDAHSAPDIFSHNPFYNWTAGAVGNFTSDPTFQDDISLTSSVSTSFNFDLSSFLTFTSPALTGERTDRLDDTVTLFVVLKVIILTIISLVGSLGNVAVIWSVVKERHLHRPPFYFLLSLGVTDLSRAIFCVPVVISTVLHGSEWRHGESACKLFAFATSFFVFSSALSLLAISIDRHIAIVYSKTYRRRSLGIANLVVAVIIWIIAFSVSFPPVVGVGDYIFIPDEAQCAYHHKHLFSNNDAVSSVLIFVAILFLTYLLYIRIFRFLRSHRRMRPLQHTPALSANWAFVGPGANGQAFINWLNGFGGQVPLRQGGQRSVQRLNFGRVVNLSTAKNEHLTRLFLLVTLTFGITWSPYIVLSMWRVFFDSRLIPPAYVTVAAWLGYAQVAICPIVYFTARGPVRPSSRTVYSPAEKREFLLENKIPK